MTGAIFDRPLNIDRVDLRSTVTPTVMIRIFLADEQPAVLAGLRSFFSGTEFQVVGDATSGLDLVRGIERSGPELVLIDTNQTSFQGFSEGLINGDVKTGRWRYKIVEYSPRLKAASRESLLAAIRRLTPKRNVQRPGGLTHREIDVLRQIVQGRSNKEIARSLGITLETVKEHVQNILRKTSLSDRTQAALWAVRNDIASL